MSKRHITKAGRTESFSDAFFAIAITLLVLEFRLPEYEKGGLLQALGELWPSIFAFVFSFTYIGVIWLNHHALFARLKFVDKVVHWNNLGILMTTILLAFPTGVLADAFRKGNLEDQGAAVMFYSITAGAMSAAWIPMFEYLKNHPELLSDEITVMFFKKQRIRPWIGVVSYGLAAAVGYSWPLYGLAIFLLMILYHGYTSGGIAHKE